MGTDSAPGIGGEIVPVDASGSPDPSAGGCEILVSEFDYSVKRFFEVSYAIDSLCGDADADRAVNESDAERFSSRITFLSEWKYFNYEPKTITFKYDGEAANITKITVGGVHLPQFSSASVPKKEAVSSKSECLNCKDFVLHAGGSVWALDWCPRLHRRSNCHFKCEYLAVAAHPPGASYHQIGLPLTGRGLVQIWCILTANKEEKYSKTWDVKTKCQGRPRKYSNDADGEEATKIKGKRPRKYTVDEDGEGTSKSEVKSRPRGRPRKCPLDLDGEGKIKNEAKKRPRGRPRKHPLDVDTEGKPICEVKHKPGAGARTLPPKKRFKMIVRLKHPTLSDRINDAEPLHLNSMVSCNQLVEDSPMLTSASDNSDIRFGKGKLQEKEILPDLDVTKVLDLPKRGRGRSHTNSLMMKPSASLKVSSTNYALEKSTETHAWEVDQSNTRPLALSGVVGEGVSFYPEDNCLDSLLGEDLGGDEVPLKIDKTDSLHKDIALPRVVLCLAHMGRVAWDIKWKPPQNTVLECDKRMGYLAVLLGNGSLEVWEVPLPGMVKTLYTSCNKGGTDPRFLRLNPVFRCSELKHGSNQSIPIVMEWSPSSPCDLLIAGCHDGTVALWKFFVTDSLLDAKPLICFNADTMHIRSISWAPDASDTESSNVVVTAGCDGVKFWDLRDPYRPIWDYTPVQRHILAVGWLWDPRWIILSYDDGFLRILNLYKSACDVPVTGKPSVSKAGIHSIACSAFAIWSVNVSRRNGLIAYCGADGRTNYFQLKKAELERSPRSRLSQFSCGSLLEEKENFIIRVPVPNTPLNRNSESTHCAPAKPNQLVDDLTALPVWKDEHNPMSNTSSKSKNTKRRGKEDSLKGMESLSSLCEEQDTQQQTHKKCAQQREAFPAKVIAMHKVRWNINRGSESWLSYGGAAGIVRCQEILKWPS